MFIRDQSTPQAILNHLISPPRNATTGDSQQGKQHGVPFKIIYFFIASWLLCYPPFLQAQTQHLYAFPSDTDRKRFDTLVNQTRCLVCKNQSIQESHTHLARDLRQKIYEQIQQGKTNQAIQHYLSERYGDFILFQPRLKPSTYFLWFAPLIFLILAICCLFYVLNRHQKHDPTL